MPSTLYNPFRLVRVDQGRGEDDGVVTTEYGKAFSDLITNSRFLTIPAAGHYPHIEQCDAVMHEITAFIR